MSHRTLLMMSSLSLPQLTIRVQNVPALSGGVSCVFEDLSESSGEVVAKGQVMCLSPSLRDLPAHTHSYGETDTHTQTCRVCLPA